MNSHEGAPQPNSSELSNEEQSGVVNGWESVAALADEYEDREESADRSIESLRGENTETETEDEVKAGLPAWEQASAPKPADPREVIRRRQQNKSIARQSAINVVESQIKLNEFQTAALESKIKDFKSSHGFFGRRFGKSASEFQDLKRQLNFLHKQRAELDEDLATAKERFAATISEVSVA